MSRVNLVSGAILRKLLFVLALMPALAACGLARQAELRKQADEAKVALVAARDDCRTRKVSGEFKSFVAVAKCHNDAENQYLRPLLISNQDLFNVRLATRMAIAEKMDHKETPPTPT
jgi:hypothetical protein